MTPTAYIVGMLVDNAQELGLTTDNIQAFMIDEDFVDNGEPIVVVSENTAGQHDFGNNDPISTLRRIQIEFYYPKDYEGDMDLIEKSVKSFLRAQDIKCYSDAGHIIAPDSHNIMNTLRFNYLERNI